MLKDLMNDSMLNHSMLSHFAKGIGGFLGLCLLTFVGCQHEPSNDLVEVIGEVSLNRSPCADAVVIFAPRDYLGENDRVLPVGYAQTNNAGRFEIEADGKKGLRPGAYRVIICRGRDDDGPNRQLELQVEPFAPVIFSAEIGLATSRTASDIPFRYNLETELETVIQPAAGIVYPKFELVSDP